jgi:hypothetical protein
MRILLDESLPRSLRGELPGHSVRTVAEMNWSAVENGELLRLAATQFDAFVTAVRLGASYPVPFPGLQFPLEAMDQYTM